MSVCDVYHALTEERPYRANLPAEMVWSIIDDMVKQQHLDASLVVKLKPIFVITSQEVAHETGRNSIL